MPVVFNKIIDMVIMIKALICIPYASINNNNLIYIFLNN